MLEVRALSKHYPGVVALDEVSFFARPGEVTGYLGPNGSGKSTTVKMLTGMIEPTSGEILYRGRRIRDWMLDYKRLIGYVPEEPHLYTHLTGSEYLELVGQLRAIPEAALAHKIEQFLRLFSLWEDRYTPMSSYSKGMRQKVLIAAALLHNPEIVILDEPLSGLDVNSSMVLRSLIQALAAEGKVVLFSSHVLEVVEKICTHVVILRKGRAVANDSISKLRELMSLPSLEDIFSELVVEQDTGAIARQLIEAMRA